MAHRDVIVKEAMKMKPVTITPDTSVQEAAKLMRKHRIGSCIVVEDKPIGIVTESDIVQKVVSLDKQASSVKVKEIMSSPLIIIDPYKSIEEAMRVMARCNIRR
ncbi:MAG TPA: CBS domain-containing protein, partial [Thermoplasmatales archaeon]|nr:CBS domain-containing protein [Thermoplasmatales archaeon]